MLFCIHFKKSQFLFSQVDEINNSFLVICMLSVFKVLFVCLLHGFNFS